MAALAMTLLSLISVCLILVILVQRGRGGGLVSAFGGMSGQSAFGTRAGDIFTKITIGLIAVWVIVAGLTGILVRRQSPKFNPNIATEVIKTDASTTPVTPEAKDKE
jgi:preprotein translocase subunit SecG